MDSLAGSGLESAFPHCRGGPAKVAAQAIENHRGRVRMRWVRVSHSGNMRQAALEIDDHVPTMRAAQGKRHALRHRGTAAGLSDSGWLTSNPSWFTIQMPPDPAR